MKRAATLGVVQGITEFLPVSSSAHLELLPWLLGWEDLLADREAKKSLDVALHVGSLAGVVVAAVRLRPAMRVLGSVVAASAPAALVGGLGKSAVVRRLGRPRQVAAIGALAGVALWLADRRATRAGDDRRLDELTFVDVAVLGAAQALALVPGVSRAGATYTAGRLRGLAAEEASSYSLLLGLPVVAGAGLHAAWGVRAHPTSETLIPRPVGRSASLIGAIAAAVTGSLVAVASSRFTARAAGRLAVYRTALGGLVLLIDQRRRRAQS